MGGLLQGLGEFYGGCPPPSPGCLSPGATRPRTLRLLCPRRQSNQNAAGDTPDPAFVQSDACRGDTGQPLKYLFASGSLVIGAVLCRTSPDGPRADRHFLACETERWFYPCIRAGGPSQNRNPAEIRCQRAEFQWQSSIKSGSVRLGKSGGPARRGLAVFSPFLGGQKWGRRRQNRVEGPDWPSRCRRRQNREKAEGGQGAPLPLASFFSLHRGRSTAAAGYLCLPWKNSAIVPGPEWFPMTGPT